MSSKSGKMRKEKGKAFQIEGVQSWNPEAHLSDWCNMGKSGRNLGCMKVREPSNQSLDASQSVDDFQIMPQNSKMPQRWLKILKDLY